MVYLHKIAWGSFDFAGIAAIKAAQIRIRPEHRSFGSAQLDETRPLCVKNNF
jgi:hypothetical protein